MLVMPRWVSAPILAIAIILALGIFRASAARADDPKGFVVVARTAPTALLVWDASPVVGDIVIAGHSGDAGMRALEAQAISLLGVRAGRMRAAQIELKVQYAPGGIVGAAYQASTFANESPLFTLSAPRALAAARSKAWAADVAAGRIPAGLHIAVTGSFPQSQ